MIKVIDSIQYHIWSDALHARQLARQTQSPWDRGAYVRWAIQTAWSAFEKVCTDVLAARGLGMRFRERFDEAVAAKGLPSVDWGQGVWQQVLQVYKVRKEFVHVVPSISCAKLMTPSEDADRAITILRDAIRAVSDLAGLPHPPWVNDDADPGWQGPRGGFGLTAESHIVHARVRKDDPENVRITYVLHGQEHLSEIALPGTPHGPLLTGYSVRLAFRLRLSELIVVPISSKNEKQACVPESAPETRVFRESRVVGMRPFRQYTNPHKWDRSKP